ATTRRRVTPEELATNYRIIELEGKTYYRDTGGSLYNVHEMPNGAITLTQEHGLKFRSREDLASAELLVAGTSKRAHIKAKAERLLLEARSTDGIPFPLLGAGNAEVLIDNQRVPFKNGQLAVGRDHPLGDGGEKLGDARVSPDHGTLRWDQRDGSFHY